LMSQSERIVMQLKVREGQCEWQCQTLEAFLNE